MVELILDGLFAIIASTIGAVTTIIYLYIKGKTSKLPQPLKVEQQDRYMTCDACSSFRADINARDTNIFARVSSVEQRTSKIEGTLDGLKETAKRTEGKVDQLLLKNH